MFKSILAVASLACAAFVVSGGAAHAQPFPPGVSCGGTTCRNDTDQHYLIESWQVCQVVGGDSQSWVPFNVMMKPHETVEVTGAECFPMIVDVPEDSDSALIPNRIRIPREPVEIIYSRAVTYDPNAKAPTGSAF